MPINRTRGPARKKLPNGRGHHNRRQFPTLRSLIVALPDGRVVDLVDPSRAISYGTNIAGDVHSKGRYTQNQADGTSEIQATGACQYQTFSRIAIIRRNYDTGASATISDSRTSSGVDGAQWFISGSEIGLNKASAVGMGSSSGAGISTGVEYVVGITYDGTTVRFYIDGRAVGSSVSAQTFLIDSAATLFSRGGPASPNEDLNGAIKLHSDFEGALSIDEMLAITANPALLFAAAYRDSWFETAAGVSGTIAATLSAFTSSITGTTTVTGSIARTLDNATSAIAGNTTVTGSITKTLENDVGNFQGSAGSTSGTIAVTTENNAPNMSGTTSIVGTLNASTANATSNITGNTTILGQISSSVSNFIAALYGTSGVASVVARLRTLLGVGS